MSEPTVGSEVVPGTPAADRTLALAVLIARLLEPAGAAASASSPNVSEFLSAASRLLVPERSALLARLLQPLAGAVAGTDVGALLRERVEASGVFLEARLRLALQAQPVAESEDLVRDLPPDVRAILAEFARTAGHFRTAAPLDETAGAGDERAPAGEAREPGDPIATAHQAVSDQVLRQQAEVAYHWVNDGSFVFEIPVRLPPEDARVFVEFRQERGGADTGEPRRGGSVRIHLESAALGPIGIEARWHGAACEATFYVARETACRALQGEAGSFHAALTPVFPRVTVAVVVDAARAARSSPEPLRRPAGGSIVNIRT